jgi:hypothetical protein
VLRHERRNPKEIKEMFYSNYDPAKAKQEREEAQMQATLVIDEYNEKDPRRGWNGNARARWFVDNLKVGQFGFHRAPGGWTLWKRVDARRNEGTALVLAKSVGSW